MPSINCYYPEPIDVGTGLEQLNKPMHAEYDTQSILIFYTLNLFNIGTKVLTSTRR